MTTDHTDNKFREMVHESGSSENDEHACKNTLRASGIGIV